MKLDARAPAKPSKSAAVTKLLSRTKGATSAEMMAATSWQPHSVRAFLSGLRKKGHVLARESRKSGEAAYRLVDTACTAPVADDAAAGLEAAPMLNREPVVVAAPTAPAA